jgi:hypothetical protein
MVLPELRCVGLEHEAPEEIRRVTVALAVGTIATVPWSGLKAPGE